MKLIAFNYYIQFKYQVKLRKIGAGPAICTALIWLDLTWYGLNWAVVQITLNSLIDWANELLSKG